MAEHQRTIRSLNAKLDQLRTGGTDAVLTEFGVPDLIQRSS
ncbi:MAG TPA: hypothetical protein VHL57_00985 [Flavobacteriales bacterium]|nr:hypothetical protein [Flavobacteriales bacterium]